MRHGLYALAMVALAGFGMIGDAGAEIVRQQQSRPGPGEVDTADRPQGQAGGQGLGRSYLLKTLRCPDEQAIVGLRVRRGQVLDFVQIACARPECSASACTWSAPSWTMASGSRTGGSAQPEMLCAVNEVMSAVRARVVTFTAFDYVADIEIGCSAIVSAVAPPGARSLTRVDRPTWRHSGGGLESGRAPGNAIRVTTTPSISCLGIGPLGALSTGESDFVNRGQRVVQAISLYCRRGASPAMSADLQAMIEGMDRCLRERSRVDYYTRPNVVAAASGRASYDPASGTIRYNPRFLESQPPFVRAFWLGGLFGGHVMNLEQRRFGQTMTPRGYMGAADLISGYLAHCLVESGQLPMPTNYPTVRDDPRPLYQEFLATSGFALQGDVPGVRRQPADWDSGWHGCCIALPLFITHR